MSDTLGESARSRDGLRKSLWYLQQTVPMMLREVPTGTPVLDWTVPKEWNTREAWIKNALESNRVCRNLFPNGEPQLGRRGLYRSMGGIKDSPQREMAMLWILNLSDGNHDLLQIAERAGLDFMVVNGAVEPLIAHGLLTGEGLQRFSPGLDKDAGPIAL